MISAEIIKLYSPLGIREDIQRAHSLVWENLALPGTWLTGAEKRAIAAEVCAAQECPLCRERKQALSPYAGSSSHTTASDLDPARTDAVHRIVTDPGRLTRRLLTDLMDQGISDAAYVEMLGIALFTLTIDTFHRAVDLPLLDLPQPEEGRPSEEKPSQLEEIGAWVPVLAKQSPLAQELFAQALRISNVARALSLVPEISRLQIQLLQALYLPISRVASMADSGRSLTRAQMELIASRVSALNQCFY